MKPSELRRRLERLATRRNWSFEEREGRGHVIVWVNGRSTAISRHSKDIGPALLKKIVEKDLGLVMSDLEG